MSCVLTRLLVLFAVFAYASSTSILDLWSWGYEDVEYEKRATDPRTCNCEGPSCMCCVDFNLTYVDFGGPGCVRMKYISQDEGIAVNVSYGDSLLHSKQVKGPNPEPTCMSLLENWAEICARFSDLHPQNDGLQGCLLLEPKLLGDVTTSFSIGCFTMGPEGMKLEENNSTLTSLLTTANNQTETETEEKDNLFLAAYNEAYSFVLANLLGVNYDKNETNETATESVTPAATSTTP